MMHKCLCQYCTLLEWRIVASNVAHGLAMVARHMVTAEANKAVLELRRWQLEKCRAENKRLAARNIALEQELYYLKHKK